MIVTIPRRMPRELCSLACDLESLLTTIRRERDRPSSILNSFAREIAALELSAQAAIDDLDRVAAAIRQTYRPVRREHGID